MTEGRSPSGRELVLILSPVMVLLWALRTPLPMGYQPAREISGFFEALALIRSGPGSILYLTPDESFAGLELHSLLSSPLITLGYYEGGRLVSVLASVTTVLSITTLSKRLDRIPTPALAATLLWMQPLFWRFSYSFMPEALSIAVTTAVVLTSMESCRRDSSRLFGLTLLLLAIAPTVHTWESIVLLPVVVVFALERRWRWSVVAGTVQVLSTGMVLLIGELQPTGSSTLTSHLLVDASIFFSSNFWTAHLFSLHPLYVHLTLLLPVAVVLAVVELSVAYRDRDTDAVLVSAWLVSGLSIPILLARGFVVHEYYLWGLIAPVAISTTRWISTLVRRIQWWDQQRMNTVLVVVLISMAGMYGFVFELGALAGTGVPVADQISGPGDKQYRGIERGEAVTAGKDLQALNVTDPDQVIFAGNWGQGSDQTLAYFKHEPLTRVLIYSQILPRQRSIDRTDRRGPFVVDRVGNATETARQNCRAVVVREKNQIRIGSCPKSWSA